MARKSKKNETTITENAQPVAEQAQSEVQAQIEQPVVENTQPEAKPEVTPISIDRSTKVAGISKENYKANLDRATELKSMLRQHLAETGGFPSHRFVQKTWGFNISLKAIIRHKSKIASEAGLTSVKTTDSLPRPKKVAKVEEVKA